LFYNLPPPHTHYLLPFTHATSSPPTIHAGFQRLAHLPERVRESAHKEREREREERERERERESLVCEWVAEG